jgi:hypothetical protein
MRVAAPEAAAIAAVARLRAAVAAAAAGPIWMMKFRSERGVHSERFEQLCATTLIAPPLLPPS